MFIKQADGDNVTLWVDLCKYLRYDLDVWPDTEGELHRLTITSEDGRATVLGFSLGRLQDLQFRLDRYVARVEKEKTTTDLFERASHAHRRWCVGEGAIPQEPSFHYSRVNVNTGRVILRNVNGHLATYQWDGKKLIRCDSKERRS